MEYAIVQDGLEPIVLLAFHIRVNVDDNTGKLLADPAAKDTGLPGLHLEAFFQSDTANQDLKPAVGEWQGGTPGNGKIIGIPCVRPTQFPR